MKNWARLAIIRTLLISAALPLYFAFFCPVALADGWPLPESAETYFVRAQPILDKMAGILDAEGVPRYFLFLALAESGGDPLNVSPRGAAGLWQLMPHTARAYGITEADRLDVEKSTRAAARYIRHLLDMFDNDFLWTVAAYNAGGHNLKKATGYKPGMNFSVVKKARPAAYALARTVQRMEAEYGKRAKADNTD